MFHWLKDLTLINLIRIYTRTDKKIPTFYNVLPYCSYYKSVSAVSMIEAKIDDSQ